MLTAPSHLPRTARVLFFLTVLLTVACGLAGASAQVPGVSREEMWPAPTAADWARPCLVTFQRTYEDALSVSRETGAPLLVCVNMDGEIASEHYAGIRYREAQTAELYAPYVCVIASVYRHTPRDFDEQGRRFLCPRFGSVTCGEHIAIEPGLFEQFLDGTRVAPRHIGVEQDGQELYDVYYAFDTDSVFETLRAGVKDRPPAPDLARGDRPLAERIESAHVLDREAVEQAYLNGTREERRALLEASTEQAEAVSVDLLRLAIFGLDVELAGVARRGLLRSRSAKSVPLFAEALRVPMEADERDQLLAALDSLGAVEPRARAVAVVHRGLERVSEALDVEAWSRAGERGFRAPVELEQGLDLAGRALAEAPGDPGAELDFGLAAVVLALGSSKGDERYARLLIEDAVRALARAEALGADDWRLEGLRALLAEQAGRWPEAWERAEAAVAALPPESDDAASMRLLHLFAQSRQRAIRRAYVSGEPLLPAWVTDVHAAYSVLARHPHGTAEQAAMHYDFLRWFGAGAVADQALDAGLRRFPEAWILHDRLRARILSERGADDLEQVYAEVLARAGSSPNQKWFAGYTALVSAEFHRRAGRADEARGAYERAIEHYTLNAEEHPESEQSAAHYIAVALGGRARLALERGDLDGALADLLASLTRSPGSAATLDGLNVSSVGTAQMLHARLVASHRAEDAARLGEALEAVGSLDPRLLELPAFEQGGGGNRSRSWPPRGQR